jgi:hypothetical protein
MASHEVRLAGDPRRSGLWGVSLVLAQRCGWDVSPAEGAIVAGCLGALVVWLVDFGLHFSRAHIEEREQAAGRKGPRSISDHLAATMIARLKNEPTGTAEITYLGSLSEPFEFATQLKKITHESWLEDYAFRRGDRSTGI